MGSKTRAERDRATEPPPRPCSKSPPGTGCQWPSSCAVDNSAPLAPCRPILRRSPAGTMSRLRTQPASWSQHTYTRRGTQFARRRRTKTPPARRRRRSTSPWRLGPQRRDKSLRRGTCWAPRRSSRRSAQGGRSTRGRPRQTLPTARPEGERGRTAAWPGACGRAGRRRVRRSPCAVRSAAWQRPGGSDRRRATAARSPA